MPSTPTYCPRCKVQKPGHRPAPASCSLSHHDNLLYLGQGALASGVDPRHPCASSQYAANLAYASLLCFLCVSLSSQAHKFKFN